MEKPVWVPSQQRIDSAVATDFCAFVDDRTAQTVKNTNQLSTWALDQTDDFWEATWDYFDVIGCKGMRPFSEGHKMSEVRFFPRGKINYAENVLAGVRYVTSDAPAIISAPENGPSTVWSWRRLEVEVSKLQQALRASGVGAGDRVCAVLPNCAEAVAAMLAVASVGAIWSSTSPDFGASAVIARFAQIKPKVIFISNGYKYNGKLVDLSSINREIIDGLTTVVDSVVVDYITDGMTAATLINTKSYAEYIQPFNHATLIYHDTEFNDPFLILFSSGTTGVPKCIIHRSGGVLIQHLKELGFHADVKPGDRLFYYTTLGWMMWNWLVSGLARGATLILYDGSPFHPEINSLWALAHEHRITHFGTSAKYIDHCRKSDLSTSDFDLSALKAVFSTGSPLSGVNFDYVYQTIKQDVHLASISGGTDIVSCFVGGDPTLPVFKGELQRPGFGLNVQVWGDTGKELTVAERGELVCVAPFPCMPIGFWNDDGTRYQSAYFSKFENAWCQGDLAERTPKNGFVIHGRSDTTLNPGGVRIGTSEIYAQLDAIDEITDSVAASFNSNDDEVIVLFVVLKDALIFDSSLVTRIKSVIRTNLTPRHVPAEIILAPEIPKTRTGKISEAAVRDAINDRSVLNLAALENADILDFYVNVGDLLRAKYL